jgi:hypothetical protein
VSSPAAARIVEIPARVWTRTASVDFFRGLGLWMVFVDHMAPNIWSYLTIWRFGFSDFAEIFVFLSGFIGVGSYQRALEAGKTGAVVKKLFHRVRRLYVAHILSLGISLMVLGIFAAYNVRVDDPGLYVWMQEPVRYALRALNVRARGVFVAATVYFDSADPAAGVDRAAARSKAHFCDFRMPLAG